jgi:cation:H+ antiporter
LPVARREAWSAHGYGWTDFRHEHARAPPERHRRARARQAPVDVLVQVLIFLGGLAVALVASESAVRYARALAAALGAPAFLVGVVLVSLGTDLPEIANSVTAHLQGEGDVNVGDSVGSTLTQYTFVVGLFPLVAGVLVIGRRQIGVVSALTMAGLAVTIGFVADGWLARWEGGVLVGLWALFTWIVIRALPGGEIEPPPPVRTDRRLTQVAIVVVSLAAVGAGATFAVRALVRIAELAGVPEFVLAFFGASFGTSAPEIAVDITALLRGAPGIALGDALGSSLVDATLSIGAGPIAASAAVTPRLAIVGSLYALVAVGLVALLLGLRRRHDRRSAAALLGLYLAAYAVLLVFGEEE